MMRSPMSRLRLWRCPGPARRLSSGDFMITERRLQEFIHAEINYFAGMCPQPVKLAQLFQASTAALAATLIHRHLPVHFATRIKRIEELPDWQSVSELEEVHATLVESFQNLRLLEQGDDLEPLTQVMRDLRRRHKKILPLLGVAFAQLRSEHVVNEAFANQWLENFLLARISTEMLTMHYIMLSSDEDGRAGSCMGIVDSKCDPVEVCRKAVAIVSNDPKYSDVRINVDCHVTGTPGAKVAFQFLPMYLKLLVTELLKNSAWATLHRPSLSPSSSSDSSIDLADSSGVAAYAADLPPVSVFVGADDHQVMIEISDKGGGIPPHYADKIWSYSYANCGTANGHSLVEDAETLPSSWADPLAGLGIKQRLGMGLPLTRLYTQYLGGSLKLMCIPGVGVDAFMHLRRIDVASLPD